MLVSQGKQEVVAYDLYSLNKVRGREKIHLLEVGIAERVSGGSGRGMGKLKSRGRQPGQ